MPSEENMDPSDTIRTSMPESSSKEINPEWEAGEDETGSNILVVYFSRKDNSILKDGVDAITSPCVIALRNV